LAIIIAIVARVAPVLFKIYPKKSNALNQVADIDSKVHGIPSHLVHGAAWTTAPIFLFV
jgi:hypothetical protein